MNASMHGVYSIYHETLRLLWPRWREVVDNIELNDEVRELGIHASDVGPQPFEAAVAGLQKGPQVLSLHAAAALSVYRWALSPQTDRTVEPTPEMRRNGEIASEFLKGFIQSVDGDGDRLKGLRTLSDAFLFPVNLMKCPIRDFWVRVNVGVGTEETTAAAGVIVEKDVKTLSQQLDPQRWQNAVPELFESTFSALGGSPDDPDSDPPATPQQGGWQGSLFETASWPLPPTFKVRVRNMLDVDFRPAQYRLQLKYSLRECLTGALVDGITNNDIFRDFGGVDRDSGFVDARPLQDNPAASSLSGLKSIRFSKQLEFLNPFTPGYLFFWMSFLILGGACYDFHPNLKLSAEP